MPRFRSIATALFVVVCIGGIVQLGRWWIVESIASTRPKAAPVGPHLQLVTDELELGSLEPDEPSTARFVVANSGNRPLVFRRASQGCCGHAPLPAITVEPGSTREIVLEIAPAELRDGQQRYGFHSNDPAQPEFWLTVRCPAPPPPPPPRREEHSVLVKRK